MTEDRNGSFKLPQTWIWTKIAEIALSMQNGVYKPSQFYSEDGIACLRMYNIENGLIVWKDIKRMDLTEEEIHQYELKPGDILINRVNSRELVGKAAVIPSGLETCIYESKNIRLRLFEDAAESKLIGFWFRISSQKYFNQNAQQTVGMASINQEQIGSMPIPLPPLNEQRRIVAKIEALKARSQRVKEELETIPALLDQFRQSVLAAAFRGDLTADWREKNPGVEPATRALESLREKRFSQARTPAQLQKLNQIYSSQEEENSSLLPESWRYIALEKLCDSFQYGTSAKSLASGKTPVLRMGNIQNGEIDWNDLVYTSDEEEIEKYKLKVGDVLFNRTNSPELVGKTGIYRGERPAIFAGYLIKINNAKELDSEYLNYCLNTGYAKAYCWKVKTDGVSQSNINAQKLAKFEVPFCSLEEQREVVHRINSLFLVANRLEQNYKEAKAYLNQLDRSILAKAFRGELVPQDPNDEPASVLLERIQAGRQKREAEAKTAKKSIAKKGGRGSKKAQEHEVEATQLEFPLE